MSEVHPIDIHVGSKIRQRRKQLGLSQADLAASLELTFQQVQKYERGSNRRSASKLHRAATVLNAPVSYFFEALPESPHLAPSDSEQAISDFLKTAEGIEMAKYFARLSSNKRRGIIAVIRALLMDQEEDKA